MGEPKKKIDVLQVEHLAEKQWTITEIAAHFRVNEKTIRRRFAGQIEEARQRGRTRLRDLQWKRAMEGSDRILVHMSEHYLDQTKTLKVEEAPKLQSKEEAVKQLKEMTVKLESELAQDKKN